MSDGAPRTAWVRFHCSAGAAPGDARGDLPAGSPADSSSGSSSRWDDREPPPGPARALVAVFRRAGEEWQLAAVEEDAPGAPASAGALPVSGTFGFAPGYRGCPRCGNDSYARCACGALGCWRSSEPTYTCVACGHGGPVAGPIESLGALDAG